MLHVSLNGTDVVDLVVTSLGVDLDVADLVVTSLCVV